MSTYGVTKYGEGLYGVAEDTTTLIWVLTIAWDGAYNGDNEAMRMVDCTVRRGRSQWVADDGFQPFDEGEAVCILRNDDNRYWALNSSSPLYPYVRPGPYARLSVIDGRGGTEYPVMRGYVYDIECYTQAGHRYARVILHDGLQWLKDKTGSIGYYASTTVKALITALLNAVNWNWTEWPDGLTAGSTLDHYWGRNVNILQECRDLADSDAYALFATRNGTITSHDQTTTYTTDIALTSAELLSDVMLLQRWDSLRNHVEVSYYPPTVKNVTDTLWSVPDPVPIANGELMLFATKFEYGSYTKVGPTAAVTFHLHVWTNADGTGSELTSSCTITAGPGDAWVAIDNLSGSDGYITTLEANVSFNIAVAAEEPALRVWDDDASQALYGLRSVSHDAPWQQDFIVATAIAGQYGTYFPDPQIEPEIQIENRASLQFTADVCGRVDLDVLDADGYYRIGHITHEWLQDNGQAVRTTLKLEGIVTPE